MLDTEELEELLEETAKGIAIGFLPFVGQAIDIYDTAYAAYDLYQTSENDPEAHDEALFNIGIAIIGWIPGPGDGIKHILKTVNRAPKKFASVLLDAIRHVLYRAGQKIDPYLFLMEATSSSTLEKLITGAKHTILHSSIYQRCPIWVQQGMLIGIDFAINHASKITQVLNRKVKHWLKSVRKHVETAHDLVIKIENRMGIGMVDILNTAISQEQESIGEHVGDYYCQDVLGWGKKTGRIAKHDEGGKGAKISDQGCLSRLTVEIAARGTGIDAIWETGNAYPHYAIVEYKARAKPKTAGAMKTLLVSESAQDADKKEARNKARREAKKAYKKELKRGNTSAIEPPQPPKLPQNIPKMSHKWIQQRVVRHKTLTPAVKRALNNLGNYSRHVIQVSTASGDGKTHREALDKAIETKRHVIPEKHEKHEANVDNFTNVFTEAPKDDEADSSPAQHNSKKYEKKSTASTKVKK